LKAQEVLEEKRRKGGERGGGGRERRLFNKEERQNLSRRVFGLHKIVLKKSFRAKFHRRRRRRKKREKIHKSNNVKCLAWFVSLSFLSLLYKGAGSFRTCAIILILILILMRITLHLRIANQVGEDSCCRGGSVHSRFGCSRARSVPPYSPKALWRFRVSTSNSPSGRSRLHFDTHIRYIDQIYAQQSIRVCEDDHLKPRNRQSKNPKALSLLRVSI
jgi:hypothetical protein